MCEDPIISGVVTDSSESKVYLSKKLSAAVLDAHRSARTVVQAPA